MDLPSFPLWQQTALPPSGARPGPRPPRRRAERSAATLERELRRARETARRARDTVAQGLVLSFFVAVPLGWSFLQSTLLAGDPRVQEACPTLTSFLSPALRNDVEAGRASGALSPDEKRMINLRVCDPATRLLVEPLLRGVSDLQELQDMAHGRGATLAGADPRAALPSLLGGL